MVFWVFVRSTIHFAEKIFVFLTVIEQLKVGHIENGERKELHVCITFYK